MNSYKIKGSYMAAGNIIRFHRKITEDKGNVKGKDLEGRIDQTRLTFKTENMTYRFTKRLEGKGFRIYSGEVYVEGIRLGEAVASLEK
jgi:hypothetical protein